MLEEFITDIDELYTAIKKGKKDAEENFRLKWGYDKNLGSIYQELCKKEARKQTGSFYTPVPIINFIVNELITHVDYKKNPYIRIIDPSCGGGDFLIALYDALLKKAVEADIENPSTHIMENNIFGYDIDENAVKIASIELYKRSGILPENIEQKDFLTDDCGQYDIIIGNPPYMGHKVLTGEYRNRLYDLYQQVFSDKSDISHCFIKKSIDSLKTGGHLFFLISRYILEALNARDIREYIRYSGRITRIFDFYGIRLIKGAGVDNIIFQFQKSPGIDNIFEYIRLKNSAKDMAEMVLGIIDSNASSEYFKNIKVNQNCLGDSGWVFLNDIEEVILDKIKGIELNVLCESYQGIITGCDEAFVVSPQVTEKLEIEKSLLYPWLKSKDIGPFSVAAPQSSLIYSDNIDKENNYENAVKYIALQKDRLSLRRECRRGVRKWYELQWGRNPELFKDKKIIYPFKASSNRFAIDKGSFFSADIYALKIRDMFMERISYEFLAGVLNSSIYEFYIKSMAKKLGEDMYEYYPNKILNLKMPHFIKEIENEVISGGKSKRYNIDMALINYFGITLDEYAVIRSWCI
jgi:adenine-specific DNA-methyltransferase